MCIYVNKSSMDSYEEKYWGRQRRIEISKLALWGPLLCTACPSSSRGDLVIWISCNDAFGLWSWTRKKKKRFFGDMPAPSHCSHFMPVIKNICTVNCISKCFYSKSKFSKYLTCKFPYLLSLPLTFQNTYRCDYYTCTIFKLCYNYKIIK